MAKLDAKSVEAKLRKHCGNFAAVARSLGVSRVAVHDYIAKRPVLQAVAKECREKQLDDTESALYREARKGQGWAVCFFLKTQGRSRGYVEKPDLDLSKLNDTELAAFSVLWKKITGE